MQITETKKAIIELIEPYMDKTLSEWCLCNIEWYYDNIWNQDEIKTDEEWNNMIYREHDDSYYCIDKILWHYDITAVFKYFEEHFYSWWKLWANIINIEKDYIEIREIKEMCKCDIPKRFTIVWKFSNKPLHLYTEEEDKNLLELLQKLW
jgi:hypothetical protein